MSSGAGASETILIVDDEPAVRKTFEEWLGGADLGCRILSAADAEAALQEANRELIDLAILDWNLGAGNDGLQLLEDLFVFNPSIVAIMVTGYAHQATPLDAMRMGVRDYLDKNQDLNRETFLSAVRRQLERIRPAKRERRLHQGLVAFREAVEKVLPLVQSAAALTDPVPLPEAVRSLFRFLLQSTGASDGVLLTRSYDADRHPAEICRVYDSNGVALAVNLVPFARSIAGSALSLQQPSVMGRLGETAAAESLELQPFERDRQSLLAAPLAVAPGVHVVLELFDKRGQGGQSDPAGFTEADRQTISAAAEVGSELLRQALAQRNVHQVLFSAIGAALEAGDSLSESLGPTAAQRLEQPPSAPVLERLREALREAAETPTDAEATLRLAEAIRVLTLRHGPPALYHCLRLVEDVRQLLDAVTA
jgi:DNA-binding response OmpR family regulator